jgi:Ca2+-binding EF-hand superfamily protein
MLIYKTCYLANNYFNNKNKTIGVGAGKGRPEEIWAEMFMLLDEDHDGVVDIDELRDDMETILTGETRTPEELMAETDKL